MTKTDRDWMARAIRLSRKGFPAPNPHVGCVIVRDGSLVGSGFHPYAGGDHAEIAALREAGARASGSTVYVTLEPCNSKGRTGPCSRALVEAGVAKVLFAVADPNPAMSGGSETLRESGVNVEGGLLALEAARENAMWLKAMALRRPFVIAKVGMSLDGRIALESGESQWITSDVARRQAMRLRAQCAAVLVGRTTVEVDDPLLTARVRGVRNPPLKVVLDPSSRLAAHHKVFQEGPIVRFTGQASRSYDEALTCTEGRFSLRDVLAALWGRGITSVLVEGGGNTIGGFVAARLVDRYELFMAPALLGNGPSWLERPLERLADADRLRILTVSRAGRDLRISAEPLGAEE